MEKKLNEIIEILLTVHGIDISGFDRSFLEKSVERRLLFCDLPSISDYQARLKNSPAEADQLIDSLHISFSEFFRNPLTFAYLEQLVLPLLETRKRIRKEAEIRIWSAACASGQEAYSIAILLEEMRMNNLLKNKYRIFATDNNPLELIKAQEGIFHSIALGKTTLKRIQTYFIQNEDKYRIVNSLKEKIDFSFFDLLSDQRSCPAPSIYGNFDIVFCSNLLFYYKQDSQVQILEKIANTMNQGGYLITGETEREILIRNNYHEVYENSAIFQKKMTSQTS